MVGGCQGLGGGGLGGAGGGRIKVCCVVAELPSPDLHLYGALASVAVSCQHTPLHDFLDKGCWSGFGATKAEMYLGSKATGLSMTIHDLPGTPGCSSVYAVPQCHQQDNAHLLTDGTLYFQVLWPNTYHGSHSSTLSDHDFHYTT